MTWTLLLEQLLNGLQFGLMLFLIAAGLTLVFGIMDIMNLAHGSLYMAGAGLGAGAPRASGPPRPRRPRVGARPCRRRGWARLWYRRRPRVPRRVRLPRWSR